MEIFGCFVIAHLIQFARPVRGQDTQIMATDNKKDDTKPSETLQFPSNLSIYVSFTRDSNPLITAYSVIRLIIETQTTNKPRIVPPTF